MAEHMPDHTTPDHSAPDHSAPDHSAPDHSARPAALSRRRFVACVGGLAGLAGLAACDPASPFTTRPFATRPFTPRAANPRPFNPDGAKGAFALLPLSGSAAAVGQDMARAMSLAASGQTLPTTLDCGDSAETATTAARTALAAHARLILGPLRADQVPAVLALAGTVPVVTFSNDESLAGSGAFLLGVTPAQSVATMFSYARSQGASRVALVAADTPYGRASASAAQAIATAGGLHLSAILLRDPAAPGLVSALRSASGGVMPEAVLLPDRGAALQAFARGLRAARVQIMGSLQWGLGADATALANPDLDGAWFAAPPPAAFQAFADRFEAAFGTTPGFVAALGFDAATLALSRAANPAATRKAILRPQGFDGALGHFQFRQNGTCSRNLAVLSLKNTQITQIAEVTET